jgi:hypothetical protein
LRDYKNQIASRGIYAEFADEGELRQKVSRNLVAMMVRLSANHSPVPAPRRSDLARVFIQTRPGERSGDVRTVKVVAVIENFSPTRRIGKYVCTISVSKECLTTVRRATWAKCARISRQAGGSSVAPKVIQVPFNTSLRATRLSR